MAKVQIVNKGGAKTVFVDGLKIPDVMSATMYVRPGSVDSLNLSIAVDELEIKTEQRPE